MSDNTPLRASVVRIVKPNKQLVGMGYLVAPDTVITCAHVVASALGCRKDQLDPPDGIVEMNRPLIELAGDKVYRRAQVQANGWYPACAPGEEPASGLADIAVLRIIDQPYTTPPALAPLAPGPQFDHLTFETYGCPKGHEENAVYTEGLTRALIGNGRILVQGTSGYPIEPGYSGTPVWCGQVHATIGILAQDEQDHTMQTTGFVIPSPLLLQACPAPIREAIYRDLRACRDALVRGIDTSVPASADAIRRCLDTYLGRPEQPVPFGGRGGALKALDDWLTASNLPHRLLVAPAGRGKSALLAHWVMSLVQRQMQWDIIFLPLSLRFQTSDEITGLRCLAARLQVFFPRQHTPHTPHLTAEDYKEVIHNALTAIGNYPQRRFVLVVDGVDEAIQGWFNRTLLPYDLPPNLKVLLSARAKPGDNNAIAWLQEMDWTRYAADAVLMDLPRLTFQGISDVLSCMGRPLDRLADQKVLIEQLYRLSDEGDPLLVRLYIEQLWIQRDQIDRMTVTDLKQLRPGFTSFLQHWFRDQQRQRREWTREMWERLLVLLATAQAPMKRDDLQAVAAYVPLPPLDQMAAMLDHAFSLVVGDSDRQGYVLIHPRLNEYFVKGQEYARQQQGCRQAFLDWCGTVVTQLESGTLTPEKCPEYVLRTCVRHLQQGKAGLDSYLALVGNGWRRAWFALEGTYTGFLTDVQQVLETLSNHNETRWRTVRQPVLRIGAEMRCLLCMASVRALANNIPPNLIVQLIDANIWLIPQALQIITHLDDGDKAQVLSKIAPRLRASPDHLQQALHLTEQIIDDGIRAETLTTMAECLAGERRQQVLERALAAAERLPDEIHNIKVFITVATQLAGERRQQVLEQALATAEQIPYKFARTQAVAAVATQLAGERRQQVLEQALAAAEQIDDQPIRVKALAAVAPQLEEERRQQVLEQALYLTEQIARNNIRAEVLGEVVEGLAGERRQPMLERILAAAEQIDYQPIRAKVLTAVATQLEGERRQPMLERMLAAAEQMDDGRSRARILIAVMEGLAGERRQQVLEQGLAMAGQIADDDARADALTAVARWLAGERRQQALEQALAAAEQIPNEFARAQAMVAVATQLAGERRQQVLEQALATAEQIPYEGQRPMVLIMMAERLEGEERQQVLERALTAVQQIPHTGFRAETLTMVAEALAGERRQQVLEQALAIAGQIADDDARAGALTAVAERLEGEERRRVLEQALTAAQQTADKVFRVKALTVIAKRLEGEERQQVLEQALTAAEQIDYESFRFMALTAVAEGLEGEAVLLERVLTAAEQMAAVDTRARVLIAVAERLKGERRRQVLERVLAAAGRISRVLWVQGLVVMAEELEGGRRQQMLKQALATVKPDNTAFYVEALMAVASRLRGEERQQVLERVLTAVEGVLHSDDCAQALIAVAEGLEEERRQQVLGRILAAAERIADDASRTRAFVEILKITEPFDSYELWARLRALLRQAERSTLFSCIPSLVDLIEHFGGKSALDEVIQAIVDVSDWWP
jgi:hypothetical protein